MPARLEALRRATAHLEQMDPATLPTTEPLHRARSVLERGEARRGLSTAHTVVAFAGATGSGKSSLVNAVSGSTAATVGARRPTTATALGVFSGDHEAAALLDWLGVQQRHQSAGLPANLVLVDTPDVDSVQTEHHRIADTLIEAVDVLVWVLDPQKYADAIVHTRYLQPMARHAQVTAVVLNQADLLSAADLEHVLADLHRRLAEDNNSPAHVLTTSASTGEGVAELRRVITDFAQARSAAHARLSAEVARVADEFDEAYPPPPTTALDSGEVRDLHRAMARAAGVDHVADTVAASHRYRSRAHTGWPLTRWLRRLRPDPMQRLHLPDSAGHQEPDGHGRGPAADQQASLPAPPVTTVTSREGPAPVEVARVESALGRIGWTLARDAGEPWQTHLRTAGHIPAAELADALDAAVVRATPRPRTARWWSAIGLLHWVLVALLAAGGLWLGVLAVAAFLQIPTGSPPQLGPVPLGQEGAQIPAIPWPTALFLTGLLGGLLLAAITGLATRIGARRRRARAVRDLTRTVEAEVDRLALEPARRALEAAADYHEALGVARSALRR